MWIWVLLLAIGTFVIAAASIGSVTGSLSRRPRRSVYDLAEAVDFVAQRLDDDVTAQIGFDDVEAILSLHCDYLVAKGLASEKADDTVADDLVVVADDEPVAWVIGRLEASGRQVADEHVVAVLDAEEQYYEAIGAIGPRVAGSGADGVAGGGGGPDGSPV
jgi:hypothetical protein